MLRPHTPLFNVATDASNGGGAASTPPDSAPAAEQPKPSVIAQATALLRGANGNAATIAALRADLTTRDSTITQLQSDLASRDEIIHNLNSELQIYRTQAGDLQAAVTALQAKQTDVQTEVIHQLAAAGLPESSLPAGSSPDKAAKVLSWTEFQTLSHPERNAFFREGGHLLN